MLRRRKGTQDVSPEHLTLSRLLIDTRRRSTNVGCIVITALAPKKYDPLSTRRTPFPVTGWKNDQHETTYRCGSSPDLRVLETNRQIYHEASIVFYSQNMFYAHGPSVLVPFLKDRGSRNRSLIRKMSIQYPSSGWTWFGVDKDGRCDFFCGDLSVWEDACSYIGLNMPGLAQLDLRNARHYTMEHSDDEDVKNLQPESDFPAQRREVLASFGPETKLTVSESEWWRWKDIKPEDNLFSPLRPWLRYEISHIQVKKWLTENPALVKQILRKHGSVWPTRHV